MLNIRSLIAASAAFLLSAAAYAGGEKERFPAEINVSFVESPFNIQIMAMKERGLLEQSFGEIGVAVKWHAITSGAQQTQAIAARSLDIGSVVGSTSVILANAAGNRVEIADVVSRPKKAYALMVGPSGPASVAELKGKTVAGPKGTILHQMLVSALVAEGVDPAAVQFISMGLPEARAALLAGKIDGALQAASQVIRGEEAGLRVLFTADGYLTPVLVTAVRPAFAKDYPQLLERYLRVQREATKWAAEREAEAVAIGAKLQGVSEADARRLLGWNGTTTGLTDADLAAMREDARFLLEQGMISASVDPADFVLPIARR